MIIKAVVLLLTIIISFLVGSILKKREITRRIGDIESHIKKLLSDAEREVANEKKEAYLQGQNLIFKMKNDSEKEINERRLEIKREEDRLNQKEEYFEKRSEALAHREAETAKAELELVKRDKDSQDKATEINKLVNEQKAELERVAQMTTSEAREVLLKNMEESARHEAGRLIRKIEAEAKEVSDQKSKEILALAVKRYASDYVAEHTISVVNLPNEEMKGRIIGREGRNIRAIEATTGVDLIIDDTPEAVILSSFSPIRREIARQSLERLILDGRIHPARIEEVVAKVSDEMELSLKEIGKEAAFDVGVHGIHHELVKLLGKLKYRTSFAQNVLQHSMEVAFLCGIMAAELGQNIKQAKRAGLLHDIGKAVDHEVEGPHGLIGAELAKRYGESPAVIHSIMAHHEDTPPESILDVLVQAADSLSGARPGARREMLETYVKRLEDLERIANSFNGISKTFAIQAGREIRIMVNCEQISDDSAVILANDICRQVEKEMTYPGQIKVTVIRETRAVSYAK
ncbi:MAG: ribonuclease Y [Deltaproteobacteria bacterium]|nr:ribonuclease Y [Deltaproteobacteria bacterium]